MDIVLDYERRSSDSMTQLQTRYTLKYSTPSASHRRCASGRSSPKRPYALPAAPLMCLSDHGRCITTGASLAALPPRRPHLHPRCLGAFEAARLYAAAAACSSTLYTARKRIRIRLIDASKETLYAWTSAYTSG